MSRVNLALASGPATVAGSNLTWVIVVAVVALCALGVAGVLVREVLAASKGTAKMQEISQAVQEGAAAYLRRQFRTLGVFVVVIFFVLLLLPADGTGVRWGRSVFFLVGALFSALTGFIGMSLTVRGNVRVAAAAKEAGERSAMRIAFRSPDSRAAAATLTLPRTASDIPVNPVSAENSAPHRKKMDRPHLTPVVSAGSRSRTKKITITNTPRVRNWRRK